MTENNPYETYKQNKRNKPEPAMLSNAHREYLRSDGTGYASSTQSDYEKAIARRVFNTYLDFSLLIEQLPKDRRVEIFDIGYPPADDDEEEKQEVAANNLHDGLNDTIAFLFLLLENEHRSPGMHDQIRQLTFRRVLTAGVSKAVKQLEDWSWPWLPTVDVDFNVQTNEPEWADVNRVIDKIAAGNADELSGAKARWFIQFIGELENDPLSQEKWDIGGWEDLGEQIQQRRAESEDIITREDMNEFADLPDEEVRKRLEDRRSDSEK